MSDEHQFLAELEIDRAAFQSWQEPTEFLERYKEVDSKVCSEFLFNRNKAKWIAEAAVLSEFGVIARPKRMRLNSQDPPDAFIDMQGEVIPIEITVAMEADRKIGLEYRANNSVDRYDNVEDWRKLAEAIPSCLVESIRNKQQKRYQTTTELLVYLNMNDCGIRQLKTELRISDVLAKSYEPFAAVHVLWKDKLFSSRYGILVNTSPDF